MSCLVALCCGLWNGGGVMACVVLVICLVFLVSLPLPLPLVLVFGVVRAQLCEHARYPRTPLCSLVASFVFLFFSLLPVFLRAPPFRVWNGGG